MCLGDSSVVGEDSLRYYVILRPPPSLPCQGSTCTLFLTWNQAFQVKRKIMGELEENGKKSWKKN